MATRENIQAQLAATLTNAKLYRMTVAEIREIYSVQGLGHGYGTSKQVLVMGIERQRRHLNNLLEWHDDRDALVAECVTEFGWDASKFASFLDEKGLMEGYTMRNKAREVAAFAALMS